MAKQQRDFFRFLVIIIAIIRVNIDGSFPSISILFTYIFAVFVNYMLHFAVFVTC
jgi:hypothetical protein